MEGLPQKPTVAEPPDEQHPTKGRCVVCHQRLRRLWVWEFGRWMPDKWCTDACYQKATATVTTLRIAERAQAKPAPTGGAE